ncbi:TPA: flagellar hook-length control protein FliK [Burkholderia vietnamiensis]|uniref:flagellar hook-length control protein FliK n=1 Tax=Burkholderia vietnamiensis TaxID=60552 RepID=UPI0009BE0D27|nr:flagellar hook-length control protein FliK [Burkholderia vietnamiensis]MCA8070164.1 flagellar hook-length control protein FliK [Burkholderia vietnamiensis]UEC03353.1 flagellar hook-length control protein FliK [Burkholderia vietnamiensis]HDR8991717.1 flagellar hook-length control protein FliK [Burkholderia vietnamiensis]HDR9059126.1 flagellar hook-length control protein FliK [Burkholderia vietnamiensis]
MRQWPSPIPFDIRRRWRDPSSDSMTESVSVPRSRSRSSRSSTRSRSAAAAAAADIAANASARPANAPAGDASDSNRSSTRSRSAAAAADSAAKASARPANAPAGDASRDEVTLDLFGDPVLEPAARGAGAARDDTSADARAAATTADSEDAGRQATLDGFGATSAIGATAMRDGDVAASAESEPGSSPAAGHGDTRDADVVHTVDPHATQAADIRQPADVGAIAISEPAIDGAQAPAGGVPETAAEAVTAAGLATETASAVADAAAAEPPVKSANDAELAGTPDQRDEAERTRGQSSRAGRASSGRKRRAASGARETTAAGGTPEAQASVATAEPVSASVPSSTMPEYVAPSAERQASVEPAKPAAPAAVAIATSAGNAPRTAAPTQPAAPPVASAASFVTKPSADRAQPAGQKSSAFDPDVHLRPLSERLAALQSDTAGIKQVADREMRRVNRLLLTLAVVVCAGLVALVLQTRQIAQLKQDLDVRQQRIDRLAADLSAQQATLMTLADRHEALLSQVDRLQRNANREAAAAKRVRRTR